MTTTAPEADDGVGAQEDAAAVAPELPPIVWDRRERLFAGASIVGVVSLYVRAYGSLPFTTYLLTRPVQHLVFAPSTVALITAGAYARTGREPSALVLVVAMVSYLLFDPLRWFAGARYGDRVARWMAAQAGAPERGSKKDMVGRVERFVGRWGTWALVLGWYTPVPMFLVHLAAGMSGMSFRRFMAADVVGVLLWVVPICGLGYVIGQPAVDTVKAIAHYGLLVTIAAVVIAVVLSVIRVRRQLALLPPE